MDRKLINDFIRANQGLSRKELAKKCGLSVNAVRMREQAMELVRVQETRERGLTEEREEFHGKREERKSLSKYKEALLALEEQEQKMASWLDLHNSNEIFAIKPYESSVISEATAVCLASDWHVEERVDRNKTNGLNEYSLAISKERATQFFQRLLKLVNKERQDVSIKHIVLALLGDFITGNIHEELPALCAVPPTKAILIAQEYIASGIQFLLDNSDYQFTIVCTCGNHARITKKVHWGNEQENSLEYLMYHNLRQRFEGERVHFIISEAYHCMLKVYDMSIRFHHGHTIKFLGGIGGLTVPVNNKIYKWSRSPVKADLDCFG